MLSLLDLYGYLDRDDVLWRLGEAYEANALLADHHYLGPLKRCTAAVIGTRDGTPVAAMLWKPPTARNLPSDGSWLELARWCLTPAAGDNAGSRMHKWTVKLLREHRPDATTLVSYSDPGHGHTGSLYRACNWQWAPTWHRLRTPPTGNGDWGTGPQHVKDRWVFPLARDPRRDEILAQYDAGAVRHWQQNATPEELRWAARSDYMRPHLP